MKPLSKKIILWITVLFALSVSDNCKSEVIVSYYQEKKINQNDSSSILLKPNSIGNISVINEYGDLIEIVFPNNCVKEPTLITVRSLKVDETEKLEKVVSPGIKILPEGLILEIPATIFISYNKKLEDINTIRIFSISNTKGFEIVPWQIRSDSTIQGKLYHFSKFMVGKADESGKNEISSDVPDYEPGSVTDLENIIGSQLEAFTMFEEIFTPLADDIYNRIGEYVTEYAKLFLEMVPSDGPCGNYFNDLLRLDRILVTLSAYGIIEDQSLLDSFRQKASDIYEQCPLSAKIKFDMYTIPAFIEAGYENPFKIEKDESFKVKGDCKNIFYIGGPGKIFEGKLCKMTGQFINDDKIEGEVIFDKTFIEMDLSFTMKSIEGKLDVKTDGEVIISADVNDNYVYASIIPVAGGAGGANKSGLFRLNFQFVDGYQIIQKYFTEDGELSVVVWTLNFEN